MWGDEVKARIEKKLSKKLFEIAPKIFKGAWIYSDEPTELAYQQGSRVSGVLHIGGGVDYWGEGQDSYTLWEWFRSNWYWVGDFKPYPEGHEQHPYPNTEGFKPTTINLLKLAASCNT